MSAAAAEAAVHEAVVLMDGEAMYDDVSSKPAPTGVVST